MIMPLRRGSSRKSSKISSPVPDLAFGTMRVEGLDQELKIELVTLERGVITFHSEMINVVKEITLPERVSIDVYGTDGSLVCAHKVPLNMASRHMFPGSTFTMISPVQIMPPATIERIERLPRCDAC